MKKLFILAALLLISTTTFGQSSRKFTGDKEIFGAWDYAKAVKPDGLL